MKIGDNFSSFHDFEVLLKTYKEHNFIDYSIKDCKTLTSIRSKYPGGVGSNAIEDLKYYYIKYICVHGGVHKKRKTCRDKRITLYV